MEETKVGYRYLHAHTAPIAPGFENALLVPSEHVEVVDGLCQGQFILAGLWVLQQNGGAIVFDMASIRERVEDVGQVVVGP
jgi:hypothetical protein